MKYTDAAHFAEKREYIRRGYSLNFHHRRGMLETLKAAIREREDDILEALETDLGKTGIEAYASEIAFVYSEIDYALKHLRRWMKAKKVSSPLLLLPGSSRIYPVPKGIVLIISPWNYPFQLLMAPLVAAIAGGNAAVLKPSELTPATAEVIEKIIHSSFTHDFLSVVCGEGHLVVPELIGDGDIDHVFFTGSVPIGRKVAVMAAERLIPVTLELGGKSPAIVHSDADIPVAARRIAYGKFLNAGQTCVAPDYLLVHRDVRDSLVDALIGEIRRMYPDGAAASPDYGKIVNHSRLKVLQDYLSQGSVIFGADSEDARRYLGPTLMENCGDDSPVMNEEIFGPILPLAVYGDTEEAIARVENNPNPLALYLFTKDRALERELTQRLSFGGGCVNDTISHLLNPALPFGGIGSSGQGRYHGKFGFDELTQSRAMVKRPTWFDPGLKYPPYSPRALEMLRKYAK
jgi:aldehyde dehydrogenase (NAD+)